MRRLATIVSCLLLLPALLPAQQSAFPLYFEDNAGNRDTLYLGYDTAATDGIDTAFGEADIQDAPYDTTFEVRLANLKEPPAYNFTFQTKTQIQYNRCDKVTKPPKWALHLRAEEWPITVSWDSALFDTTCLRQSLLTARHPEEWFDGSGPPLFNMKDTGSITLSPTLHYYEADTGVGGDTIHLLFLSLAADSNYYRWPGILWDSVRADYFKKYRPADTPAWLFPLIFEEGNGQRDTIYMGFDSTGRGPLNTTTWPDSNFAEVLLERDKDRFQAAWYYNLDDSIVRVSIGGFYSTGDDIRISGNIRFFNGVLPLTIWWDVESLRSDRLPFPDQGPAPRAQGELRYDLPNVTVSCSYQDPVLITDTIRTDTIAGLWCLKEDSIFFYHEFGCTNCNIGPIYSFEINKWMGYIANVPEPENRYSLQLYPNPANRFITITFAEIFRGNITIYDRTGKLKQQMTVNNKQKIQIHSAAWEPGLYFIRASNEHGVMVNKIIVGH